MIKILGITIGLYIFFEILSHGFAWYVVQFFKNAVVQDERKPRHLQFIRQTFYRLILILTIVLMSHWYTERTFSEQNDLIRFTWSIGFILLILFIIWWINALIIRSVILKQAQQQSVTHVFKQKIGYIMLHPKTFIHIYTDAEYLKKSVIMNHLLSILAFIILFLDIQMLYTT